MLFVFSVRRGRWGRRHSRRLGRGCGKVQVGDDGVRRGCGVGERRWMAGTLGDEAGGRCDVGSRQGGGVEGDPQGSWWRAKPPQQSGLGNQVWGKLWSLRRCLFGLSLPHLPSVRGFFSSLLSSVFFYPSLWTILCCLLITAFKGPEKELNVPRPHSKVGGAPRAGVFPPHHVAWT